MLRTRQTVLLLFALAFCRLGLSGEPPAQGAVQVWIEAEGAKNELLPLLPLCVTISVRNPAATAAMVTPLVPDSNWILWNRGRRGAASPLSGQEVTSGALYHFLVNKDEAQGDRVLFADFVHFSLVALDSPTRPSQIRKTAISAGEIWLQDYCLGYGMMVDGASPTVGLIFPTPGVYSVIIEMPYLAQGVAGSNEITIRVKEPESESDRRAYEMVRSSPVPAAFLAPPPAEYGSPFLSELRYPMSRDVIDLTSRILTACPDSAYAPYARLLWAKTLTERSVRAVDPAGSDRPDAAAGAQGFRLLRQCAEDANLPRRYREAALVRLRDGAAALVNSLLYDARRTSPTIDAILASVVPDKGIPPEFVLRMVQEVMQGTALPRVFEALRMHYTPQQIETMGNALRADDRLAQAAGLTPLQLELEGYSVWAREELCKLPWRDPNSGELTMQGRALSAP